MDPETYKTYLGAFGARSLDDIFYFIGKKNLSVATLLEKVNPKKTGFFDNLSKILQRNNEQKEKLEKTTSNNGVVVKGVSGLKIQLLNVVIQFLEIKLLVMFLKDKESKFIVWIVQILNKKKFKAV